MTEERWLPVEGYERYYAVSDHGRVRSLDRIATNGRAFPGRVMSPATHTHGYKTVVFKVGANLKCKYVHRMVAIAFLGAPADDTLTVNHKDGVKSNNHVANLEWMSQAANLKHARDTKLNTCVGEGHHMAKITEATVREIRARLAAGEVGRALAAEYGLHPVTISNIGCRKSWKHVA